MMNQNKKDIIRIHARLDQCEAETFVEIMEHRRTQEQSSVCGLAALETMSLSAATLVGRQEMVTGFSKMDATLFPPCALYRIECYAAQTRRVLAGV
jgi:hypothetical protein